MFAGVRHFERMRVRQQREGEAFEDPPYMIGRADLAPVLPDVLDQAEAGRTVINAAWEKS